MESQEKSLSHYLAVLRRYRTRMVIIGVTIAVLSFAVAIGLPPLYRSSGTILIEQQEIPQEMVRSTITSFADQRIHVISQRVMTRANLAAIVGKYNLYPEQREDEPMEVVLEEMRDSIKLEMVSADVVDPRNGRPTQATIAFTVSYESDSPILAQKVANELVSLYLNENLKSRSESATEASGFLSDEVNKLVAHIADVESRLAEFKERNANQLPELAQVSMQMMDRTERDLSDVQQTLRSLRERKSFLEVQLTQMAQDVSVYAENGERILGPADRLKQLQIKYLGMVAVYGENHPDLIRTRKQIDSLKNEVGVVDSSDELLQKQMAVSMQFDEASKKYAPNHPEVKRLESELAGLNMALKEEVSAVSDSSTINRTNTNPAYIQLQSQLESVSFELIAAGKREQELRKKLSEYEQHLARMPQVERGYRELLRDYENSSMSYKELKAKQTDAQLAQMMESERKGERFTLVEPPEMPEEPLKPNRPALMVLGIVFAFAGGVGTAALSASVDSAVYGVAALATATGMRPLVVIPEIESDEEIKKRKRRRQQIVLALVAMALIGLIAIHLFYRPLDLLWYVLQRRLGLS
jgi:uncharacterized protein involved in exopolysaccharide biosynthesis